MDLAGRTDEGPIGRREVLGLALGASAGLLGLGHRARPLGDRSPGSIALWAADRAGHSVYGLDADALVVTRCPVAAPERVLAGDGGCWARSAVDGRADGRRRWLRVEGRGVVVARAGAPPPRSAPSDVERVGGTPFEPARMPVVRAWRGRRAGGVEVAWILRSADDDRAWLERWVARERWERAFVFALPWSSRALAAHHGGVWVVGDRVPEVWFITSTGRVVIRRSLLDLDGADDAVVASRESGGGVWIAACGALARLDRRGQRLPGQGGFAHLVSLAGARP